MNLDLPGANGFFHWVDGALYCEEVPLAHLAEKFGTPLYVYSERALVNAFQAYQSALAGQPHLVCFAVKANASLAVLSLFARLGAGFDIVSGGELSKVLAAGGDASKVIFSGVGKTAFEIRQAIEADILCFNVESAPELERIMAIARELGKVARISIRVNPDVDAGTHPYISTGLKKNKFGVPPEEARALYRLARDNSDAVQILGIDAHIGSQITECSPFVAAAEKLCDLIDQLRSDGIELEHIDFGGGLGICYQNETVPGAEVLVATLREVLEHRGYGHLTMVFEAGRSLCGSAGALLTTVQYIKQGQEKHFCIVDAGMNDMIRPSLYQAWMQIVPIQVREQPSILCDVVGPVCETGDWLGKDRQLAVSQDDVLAMMSAGAYGMTMSSQYNSRPRAAEVLVSGRSYRATRRRENYEDLIQTESV